MAADITTSTYQLPMWQASTAKHVLTTYNYTAAKRMAALPGSPTMLSLQT